MISGTSEYPLPDKKLALRHDLFDDDALLLGKVGHSVELKNGAGTVLQVDFPQMDYVSFWHNPKTDAPFLCIQPWCSIPAFEGEKTVFEGRKDLLSLKPGKVYENTWSVTVKI